MRLRRIKLLSGTTALLCIIALVLALVIGRLFMLQSQAAPHIQRHARSQAQIKLTPQHTSSVSTTSTPVQDPSDAGSLANWRDKLSTLHYLHGPDGWAWS